jgi:hypothetical protein
LFLSVDLLSTTPLKNFVQIPKRSYDKVSLVGQGVFDGFHLRNTAMTNQDVLNITTEEIFGTYTVFLANFENTLSAGNYISLQDPIVSWRIKRNLIGKFTPSTLAELSASKTTYIDATQANRKSYEYQVVPITAAGKEGSPLTTIAESDFYGWFLSDEHGEKVYKFDMNIESESITLNTDIKLFEGYTQFPIQRSGKRKYRSGGLSTMPYSYNGSELSFTNETLREIESFISDEKDKILKNTSGDIFKVQTSEFSYQYMDTIDVQPYTINFKWVQVGDVD